jgi:TonB family protein
MSRILIAAFAYLAFLVSARAQVPSASVGKPTGNTAVYATFIMKPYYPYFARSRHIQGSGIFQLHIRADGTVSSVDTIQSTGSRELDDSATGAFAHWRFRPPGHPTKVKMPIAFSMHGPRG